MPNREAIWYLRILVALGIVGITITINQAMGVQPKQARTDRVLNDMADWAVETNKLQIALAKREGVRTDGLESATLTLAKEIGNDDLRKSVSGRNP